MCTSGSSRVMRSLAAIVWNFTLCHTTSSSTAWVTLISTSDDLPVDEGLNLRLQVLRLHAAKSPVDLVLQLVHTYPLCRARARRARTGSRRNKGSCVRAGELPALSVCTHTWHIKFDNSQKRLSARGTLPPFKFASSSRAHEEPRVGHWYGYPLGARLLLPLASPIAGAALAANAATLSGSYSHPAPVFTARIFLSFARLTMY